MYCINGASFLLVRFRSDIDLIGAAFIKLHHISLNKSHQILKSESRIKMITQITRIIPANFSEIL